MTRNELSRRYPNASEDFLSKNSSDGVLSHPEPQRDKAPALGTAVPGKEESVSRTRVRFTGYRLRPLDPDNFAGSVKDCLDFLRHANLIEGDEPWRIILETEQVKVNKRIDQKTVIEIFYP